MKLFIKNMITSDDKQWLMTVLEEMHIDHEKEIRLGELSVSSMLSPGKLSQLKERLEQKEFVVLHDRKHVLAEQIKMVVMEMLADPESPKENYSTYISNRMHLNYTYLANIFSELQHITIEHFIIDQKIDKAKQLLLFSSYNIGQVADTLHYSSIGHFSNQFKKVTGLSPSEFKKKEKKTSMS